MIVLVTLLVLLVIFLKARKWRQIFRLREDGFPVAERFCGMEGIRFLGAPNYFTEFGVLRRSLGRTFSLLKGAFPVIVTSDLKLIRAISVDNYSCFHGRMIDPLDEDPAKSSNVHMFAARGERWKRLRTITSMAVYTSKIKKLFHTIDESVRSFLKFTALLPRDEEGNLTVETHGLFQNHTSDVLTRCAFGKAKSTHEDNSYHKVFQQTFGGHIDTSAYSLSNISWMMPEMKFFARFLKKYLASFSAKDMFWENLDGMRHHRRANDSTRHDFLQTFKDFEVPLFDGYLRELSRGALDLRNIAIQKAIAPGEVNAQCRFISIAGFDTTANTLTYMCHLLACNIPVQHELILEIDSVGCNFTYENVQSMELLHNCVQETLRLYPHASPLQHRVCTSNCKIGKYNFREGYIVMFDTWSAHSDSQIWGPDVDKFRPSRFHDLTKTQKQAYMPFGIGPKQCIGMRFAFIEIKITICWLLSKYRVSLNTLSTEPVLTARDTGTIWPHQVILSFAARKGSD